MTPAEGDACCVTSVQPGHVASSLARPRGPSRPCSGPSGPPVQSRRWVGKLHQQVAPGCCTSKLHREPASESAPTRQLRVAHVQAPAIRPAALPKTRQRRRNGGTEARPLPQSPVPPPPAPSGRPRHVTQASQRSGPPWPGPGSAGRRILRCRVGDCGWGVIIHVWGRYPATRRASVPRYTAQPSPPDERVRCAWRRCAAQLPSLACFSGGGARRRLPSTVPRPFRGPPYRSSRPPCRTESRAGGTGWARADGGPHATGLDAERARRAQRLSSLRVAGLLRAMSMGRDPSAAGWSKGTPASSSTATVSVCRFSAPQHARCSGVNLPRRSAASYEAHGVEVIRLNTLY
jgi:hypothetical protein